VGAAAWRAQSGQLGAPNTRLVGEGVDEHLDLALVDVVVLEDADAHADAVLAGRVPVVLLHAPVADERRVQRAEVVT